MLAKSKPVSLMPRRLSANQSLTLDSGVSCTSTQKSGRERNENSASSSQVWHRDDNLFPSTERSEREMNLRSSNRKREREVQNQLTEVKLNHNNLEISNTRYIEKVFANARQKLNRLEDDQMVLEKKGQCIDVEIIHTSINESSDSSWRKLQR